MLDIDVPDLPIHFLLHVPTIPLSHYKICVLPHLLNTARHLILRFWKNPQVPSRQDWVRLVSSIMEAEECIAKCIDKFEKFYSIWSVWINYSMGQSGSQTS